LEIGPPLAGTPLGGSVYRAVETGGTDNHEPDGAPAVQIFALEIWQQDAGCEQAATKVINSVHYQLRHQYQGAQTTKARPETRKALRAVVLGRFPHGQYDVSTIHIRSPRKATSYRSAYFEAVFPKLRITIFGSRGKHQQMLLTYKLHPRLCQQEEAGCQIGSPHHVRKSLRQYKEALQPALSRLPGAGVPPASCLVSNQTRTSHAESDRSKEALITGNPSSEVSNINLIDTGW